MGAFSFIGVALLVLPAGRTEFRSELLHAGYVVLLSSGAAATAWGTWVRFRMDGTSRAWLLSAAFAALALLFLPHALFSATAVDPVHHFYGAASRLAFGLVLIAAMSPLPVPSVLRRPRTTALLLGLAVVGVVASVLNADLVQAMLEPEPAETNRVLEIAAVVAIAVALLQFAVKWIRTRRRILITWITGVAAVGVGAGMLLGSSGWELRWWWAQLGLLVASAVFILGTDSHMARALDEGELRLVYQPKVNLRTDELTSVEALLRWQHPDHGLVPAGDFIPMAEETDLITPFTFWAISEAIAQHRRWADQGLKIPVAVNMPAQLMRDSRLLEHIKAVLADHGLDPSAVTLELTESKALESEETGAEMLAALAAFGLRIAVDDFGTGYS
ncbi:MAG: EAL domain-containing protein, partial [Actinobacteria bacterium]|nr:EAL domain-containing protein [Actinomycetota bacterium]